MPQTLLASFTEDTLPRRVTITLAVLAVYRLGEWVPLPGLDLTALMTQFRPGEFSSTLHRMSVFALGVTPMLSTLIIYELAKTVVPPFARWEAVLPQRRKEIGRWTFLLALAFAGLQGNGIAVALEQIGGLVPNPGLAFRATSVATFVAASALVLWLAGIIDRHGVGRGFWILLTAPALATVPRLVYLQWYMWGPASPVTIALMLAMILLATIVLAALSKADDTLVPNGQLLWPPILAYTTAGFLYVPFIFILPLAQAEALVETTKTGHPVRLMLVATLTVLFFLLRDRRLSGQGETSPAAGGKLPPLMPALALAAIATAADFLVGSLPLPLMIDGRALIIIVAVALSVLTVFRAKALNDTF